MTPTTNQRFSLALDSSQIVDYLTCPQLWVWKNKEQLVHKYTPRTAMDKGTIFHGLLERYYTKIMENETWFAAQQYAIAELKKDKKVTGISRDDYAFLINRFIQYTAIYSTGDFIPVKIEQGFSIPLLDTDNFFFVLEGRIDFIGKSRNGMTLFMDHKTQERHKILYKKSIQFKNYALATGINHGVINYIGLQENVTADTFKREAMYFSTFELMQWKQEMITVFFKVASAIITDKFEKNWQSCQNNGFGRQCSFTELCEENSPQARQGLIEIQYQKREAWTPWQIGEKNGTK